MTPNNIIGVHFCDANRNMVRVEYSETRDFGSGSVERTVNGFYHWPPKRDDVAERLQAWLNANDLEVFPDPPTKPPSAEAVNAERTRRIEAGVTFMLAGYGAVPVTGRIEDKINLQALKETAKELDAAGVTDPVLAFRDTNNTIHQLTPGQMIDLVDQGQAWISAIMMRSWEMKDAMGSYAEGIPADFDQDHHWPVPMS